MNKLPLLTFVVALPTLGVGLAQDAGAAPLTRAAPVAPSVAAPLTLLQPALRVLTGPQVQPVIERIPKANLVYGLKIVGSKMYGTNRNGSPIINVTPRIVMGPEQAAPRVVPVQPHALPMPQVAPRVAPLIPPRLPQR